MYSFGYEEQNEGARLQPCHKKNRMNEGFGVCVGTEKQNIPRKGPQNCRSLGYN
jgi:hypothetical protein